MVRRAGKGGERDTLKKNLVFSYKTVAVHMTTKNITVVGLSTCSYTQDLQQALAGNTPKHLNFRFVDCGGDFERKCGGTGKICLVDHDCNGFYSNESPTTCDLTPPEKRRRELCDVQGFPTFKNEALNTCHLGYEPTDHAGFLRKIQEKC